MNETKNHNEVMDTLNGIKIDVAVIKQQFITLNGSVKRHADLIQVLTGAVARIDGEMDGSEKEQQRSMTGTQKVMMVIMALIAATSLAVAIFK